MECPSGAEPIDPPRLPRPEHVQRLAKLALEAPVAKGRMARLAGCHPAADDPRLVTALASRDPIHP